MPVDEDNKEAIMVSQDYLFMAILVCLLVMFHWGAGQHSWRH
jgi:hypothetical protein